MTKKKIKLALVTTARSDYSTMYPVIKAAIQDSEIDPIIFCCGMHLLAEFGNTYKQLIEDGFTIHEKIDFMSVNDTDLALTESLSKGTKLFAEAILKHQPDFVVVSGDRIENLALYNATTALRTPVAHLCGGDITEGAFDNQVRHTMTKLSHYHFVSMPEHARRVQQMGEEPWRIVLTGDAAIDTIVQFKKPTRDEMSRQLNLPEIGELILSTFHPLTLGDEDFITQYKNILTILKEEKGIPILSYPNVDPGFKPLVELLENFKKARPDAIIRKSFMREQYYALLSHCTYMIGNSSSGLWEAPSFALPNINVGGRQSGRLRGINVIDILGLDLFEMREAVKKARSQEFRQQLLGMENPYGKGQAALLTLEALKKAPKGNKLLVKKFFEIYDFPGQLKF